MFLSSTLPDSKWCSREVLREIDTRSVGDHDKGHNRQKKSCRDAYVDGLFRAVRQDLREVKGRIFHSVKTSHSTVRSPNLNAFSHSGSLCFPLTVLHRYKPSKWKCYRTEQTRTNKQKRRILYRLFTGNWKWTRCVACWFCHRGIYLREKNWRLSGLVAILKHWKNSK